MDKESRFSKPSDSFGSPLLIGGFNLVALLIFFLAFAGGQSRQEEPVLLTSGEWSPYTGKDLPEQGIASAIVRSILENMGMPARIQFLPWQQSLQLAGQAESDDDIRGSFPYSRTPEREKDFYYSLPILSVPHGIYFNPDNFDARGISPVKLRWDLTQPPELRLFQAELLVNRLQAMGLPQSLLEEYQSSTEGSVCEPDGSGANEKALLAIDEWLRASRRAADTARELIERACLSMQDDASIFEEAYQRIAAALADIRNTSSLPPGKINDLQIAYTRQLNDLVKTYLILRLNNLAIIRISGYQYPAPLNTLLEPSGYEVDDIQAAFAHLLSSDRRLVILEAQRVADQQLQENFPYRYHAVDSHDPEFGTEIAFSDELDFYRGDASLRRVGDASRHFVETRLTSMAFSFDIPAYLVASRRNPDNRHFIQDFNRHLILLNDSGALESVTAKIERELQGEYVVVLHPFTQDGYVRGYLDSGGDDYVVLVPGTRAVVVNWSEAHLTPQSGLLVPGPRVAVKVRQGPVAGDTYFIDSRSIRFP